MSGANKTQRELEQRIRDFRKRTGGDYSCVWIAPERFALLPEAVRKREWGGRHPHRPVAVLEGVPVRILQTIDPVGQ
jgi:hypothetical protein